MKEFLKKFIQVIVANKMQALAVVAASAVITTGVASYNVVNNPGNTQQVAVYEDSSVPVEDTSDDKSVDDTTDQLSTQNTLSSMIDKSDDKESISQDNDRDSSESFESEDGVLSDTDSSDSSSGKSDNSNSTQGNSSSSSSGGSGSNSSNSSNSNSDNNSNSSSNNNNSSNSSNSNNNNNNSSNNGSNGSGTGSTDDKKPDDSKSDDDKSDNPTPNPGLSPTENEYQTCTFTITCEPFLDDCSDSIRSKLPSDGVILSSTTVEFKEGDTVYDILKRVCNAKGIQYSSRETSYGVYVSSVDNLSEKYYDNSTGWMYFIDGSDPGTSASSLKVTEGMDITWSYDSWSF